MGPDIELQFTEGKFEKAMALWNVVGEVNCTNESALQVFAGQMSSQEYPAGDIIHPFVVITGSVSQGSDPQQQKRRAPGAALVHVERLVDLIKLIELDGSINGAVELSELKKVLMNGACKPNIRYNSLL